MKHTHVFVLALLLLMGTGVCKAQNPFPDGTEITSGKVIRSRWSVAAGTKVTTVGNITSRADGTIYGKLTVNGNYTNTGWNGDDVVNGATLEIFGDLYSTQKIRVLEGGTLIVHGNYYDYGGSTSYIYGNVVVMGDVNFRGVCVASTGKLVVGGNITVHDAGGVYQGDVFALDPNATVSTPGYLLPKGDVGDVDKLVDDPDNKDIVNVAIEVGIVSSVEAPSGFTFTNLSGAKVDLEWQLNAASDSVMIAWSKDVSTSRPTNGENYETGAELTSGTQIVYKGKLENWTFSSLIPGETAHFNIWSFTSPDKEYSRTIKLEVRALSADVIFYEDFEKGNVKKWQLESDYYSGNKWFIGNADVYTGSQAAYITSDNGQTAGYNTNVASRISLKKNINIPAEDNGVKYKSAELSFYWKGIAEDGYDGGSVKEGRSHLVPAKSLSNQATWIEEVIDVSQYIGTNFNLNFQWYNDAHAGMNPGFCIDEVRVVGSEVARLQTFSANVVSLNQIDLTWKKSVDNDNVIIAYSPYGSIGRPESGKQYSVGDYLNGGGQVVYVGAATAYSHEGIFSGQMKYIAWSVKGNTYSSGKAINVKIPVSLPFVEDFEGDVSPWNFNSGYDNAWVRGKATAKTGNQSAYISNNSGVSASYDPSNAADTYLELEVDLRNYETATLSFDWKVDGSYDEFGAVYVDNTMLDRSSSTRTRRYYDSNNWRSETISLNRYTNAIHTIRFRWNNEIFGYAENPGFCIDNVKISGTIADPTSFNVVNPDDLLNKLSWQRNEFDDQVMVAWSADGVFGKPQVGVQYSVGDQIPGGGIVLCLGDQLTGEHLPLNYSTTYHYKAWSMRKGCYSTGIEKKVTTPAKVTVFSEDWEAGGVVNDWKTPYQYGGNEWIITKVSATEAGMQACISSDGQNAVYNSGQRSEAMLTVEVNLQELNTASLTFDWRCLGQVGRDYGEVYLGNQLISESKEYAGSADWQSTVIDLRAFCGKPGMQTLKFIWVNDWYSGGNPSFSIDNIEIGGIYDPSSIVDNGVRLVSEVSATVNSQTDAEAVFSFDLSDKKSKYNDITRIEQLVVSKGQDNTIANWDDALQGALLLGEGLPATGLSGLISSAGITFPFKPAIELKDQDVAKTYTLKVWLKSALNAANVEDNDVFDFVVKGSDIVTGLGDDFIGVKQAQSGPVKIQVKATALEFKQQPSAFASFDHPLSRSPEVVAVDVNGNVDKDFVAMVSLSNSGGVSMTGNTNSASLGMATFDNLIFSGSRDQKVTLQASSPGLQSVISSLIQINAYWIPKHRNNTAYIHKVVINTIDNTSGRDPKPYASYLEQETSLAVGASYDVSVVVNNNNDGQKYVNIWIDWDRSGDFETDERMFITQTSNSGVVVLKGSIKVPSDADAQLGATRLRVQFMNSKSPTASSTNNGESEDYTVILTTESWKGQNNVWDVAQNWTSGSVPNDATDVYVPDNPFYGQVFPVIATEAKMKNLNIAPQASLTIEAGAKVDVFGEINNQGTLTVENTNNNPASLITHGHVTGNVRIKWAYHNLRWWFIGHSISNPVRESYFAIRKSNDNNFVLYDYQNTGRFFKVSDPNGPYNMAAQNELRGYQFKVRKANTEVVHTGLLNTEELYSKPIQAGWQIIANPYPAYYQLPTEKGTTGDFTHTTGSVYISVATGNHDKVFETYNTSLGVGSPKSFTGLIAPSQAFYVKASEQATPGVDAVVMRASNRAHDGIRPTLKSTRSQQLDVLRVKLKNEKATDEAVIALTPDGDFAYSKMDSEQRFQSGNNVSYVYSVVDNKDVVINALPAELEGHQTTLGLRSKAGKHTLFIEGVDLVNQRYELVLEDKVEGTFIPMNIDTNYDFTSEAGTFDARFVLHFQKREVPTGIDEDQENETQYGAKVYMQGQKKLMVECDWHAVEKTIEVYSLSGQLVMSNVFKGNVFTDELPVITGMYIVKLIGDHNTFEQKIVVE